MSRTGLTQGFSRYIHSSIEETKGKSQLLYHISNNWSCDTTFWHCFCRLVSRSLAERLHLYTLLNDFFRWCHDCLRIKAARRRTIERTTISARLDPPSRWWWTFDKVYRKTISTYRILPFDSNHSVAHKMSCLKSLSNGINKLCSTPESKKKEDSTTSFVPMDKLPILF